MSSDSFLHWDAGLKIPQITVHLIMHGIFRNENLLPLLKSILNRELGLANLWPVFYNMLTFEFSTFLLPFLILYTGCLFTILNLFIIAGPEIWPQMIRCCLRMNDLVKRPCFHMHQTWNSLAISVFLLLSFPHLQFFHYHIISKRK